VVDEHQVVRAVGQARQDVEGAPGDDPRPRRREPRLGEHPPRHPLVFRLEVDRGEHAVVAHPAQQPHTADAGARTDFHDRLRAARRGDQSQRRPGGRADRPQPDLLRLPARGGQDPVFGHVPLDEVAGVRAVLLWNLDGAGDGAPPSRSA
jgi:hypothetical protein